MRLVRPARTLASPHSRSRRLLAGLVAVVLLTALTELGSITGVTGQVGPLAPTAASAQQAVAKVTLTSISPVATKDGTVKVRGHIVNTGNVTLTEVTAIFWLGQQRIDSQADLERASKESPDDRLGRLITWPVPTMDEMTDSLAPGARSDFSLELTSAEIGFQEQGVYPVGVDIRATPTDQARDTVGRAHTFLTYLPDPDTLGHVDVSFLAPIVATPSAVDATTLLDDSLAADVAPHGRLSTLLDLVEANSSGALTPVLDPNVLTEARILAQRHTVLGQGRAHADKAARTFLTRALRLFGADASTSPLVLPFANPDVTALEHAHLTDRLSGAVAASRTALVDAGVPKVRAKAASPITVWPAGGYADAATLDALADAGMHRVVLSRDSLPYLTPLPSPANPVKPDIKTTAGLGSDSGTGFMMLTSPTNRDAGKAGGKSGKQGSNKQPGESTPTSKPNPKPKPKRLGEPQVRISTPSGTLTTIVVEPTLLAGGPAGADRSLFTRQRFLAETALVAMSIPTNATYRLVAELPEDFTPGPATDSIIDPPAGASWLTAVPLPQALGDTAHPYTATATESASARANELSPSVLHALQRFLAATNRLTTITATPPNTGDNADAAAIAAAKKAAAAASAATDRGYLRTSSIAWRGHPGGGVALANRLTHTVKRQLAQVQLSAPKVVTLSGSSGSFPVTVTNELDQPVTVRVQLTSLDPSVVGALSPQDNTVDAKRRNSLKFTASSDHSGVATVEAQLFTTDGHPLGPPTRFTVRATQYGIVGWVILGAGVLLLVAAAGYRNIRDFRRRRAAAS